MEQQHAPGPTPIATPIGTATARYIAATQERRFAPQVLEAARMCLVDWFAVALGAWHEPAAQAIRATASAMGGRGEARLLLGGATSPAVAALVNGTYAHCLDFDDTHAIASSHFTAPTWAAVFALAGARGLAERDALAAFITGFEVGARLSGRSMAPALHYRGFHPTAVFGRLAAAAACAALLGLNEARTAHALGLAATQCGGLNASLGTMAKPFHAGKAALDGMLAAQLAAEDFGGATNLLETENGLCAALIQDGETRIENVEFSDGLSLLDNGFKPYACCRSTHSVMDAALELATVLNTASNSALNSGQAARVRVRVHPVAVRVAGKRDPRTPLEAKFSIPFVAALGLSGHGAGPADFCDERLADPRLRNLADAVEMATDPALGRYTAIMDVELAGGGSLHAEVPAPLGDPANPMNWEQMEAKFRGLVEPLLGGGTSALFAAVRGFDEPGSLAEVANLVRGR